MQQKLKSWMLGILVSVNVMSAQPARALELAAPMPGLGAIAALDLPQHEGEEIWIDGEALRFFLGSAEEFASPKLVAALTHLQGVRLIRHGDGLDVGIFFDRAFGVELDPEWSVRYGQPYAVEVPHFVYLRVKLTDAELSVTSGDARPGSNTGLHLKLRLPVLRDTVWVRGATINLEDGRALIEAAILRNRVAVVAKAHLTTRKFEGVDFMETLRRNLKMFKLPGLVFGRP